MRISKTLLVMLIVFPMAQFVAGIYNQHILIEDRQQKIAEVTVKYENRLNELHKNYKIVDFNNETIDFMNYERVKYDLKPLVKEPMLNRIAYEKAIDMHKRKYFAHEDPDGRDVWDYLSKEERSEFTHMGENLARGFDTSMEVVVAWMESDGHMKNILDEDYDIVGVGSYDDFVVHVFATSS